MDYYKELGVGRGASDDEIKRAYRRLARKYHPDVSSEDDANSRFQDVSEAYRVLKDPETRKLYDQFGERWQQAQAAGADPDAARPGPEWQQRRRKAGPDAGFRGFDSEEDYRSVFEDLFGRGARGGGWQHDIRGEDFEVPLPISLERAFAGGPEQVTLRTPVVGDDGRVRHEQRSLKVTIPAGVVEGQRLRLAGQGGQGAGQGERGDLYVVVQFREHSHFRADGADIHLDLPVSASEAALGASVRAPTLGGTVAVTIPAGARTDQVLRLRGRGLPARDGDGDMLLHLKIVAPEADSDELKKLYQRLAELAPTDPRAALGV